MSRKLIARINIGILLLLGSWVAYTQNQKQPAQLMLNKVKDDLYEIEGDGGNVAVYITNEGVILIDDKFDQDHDAIMYFPLLRVLHTGDMMAGTSPLIDYPGGGSLIEWTKTLDEAMKLDFDTVIPGHGAVTNKAGLMAYRNNVEKLQTRVSGLIKQGKKQDEIAKVMTDEYGWMPGSLQQQWSVPGFFTEFKK